MNTTLGAQGYGYNNRIIMKLFGEPVATISFFIQKAKKLKQQGDLDDAWEYGF